jgi:hypothetical protein
MIVATKLKYMNMDILHGCICIYHWFGTVISPYCSKEVYKRSFFLGCRRWAEITRISHQGIERQKFISRFIMNGVQRHLKYFLF